MKRKIIAIMWCLFLAGWLGIAFTFFAISQRWIGYFPPIEELQNPIDRYASQVLFSDGQLMGSYANSKDNRIHVRYSDISPNVINALVATEDVRFQEHSGIDFLALGRAIVKTGILRQSNAGGGSTITQQLAKQLHSPKAESTLERLMQKPIEWVIAVQLERFYTKEEIIEMYLNQFDFLYNAVGIRSAAQTYFSKQPSELSIEEAAMLVGMCKNPAIYNPILHKDSDRPIQRRNVVFDQMRKAGMLTSAEADSLSALPIRTKFRPTNHKDGNAPYLREHLRRILMAKEPKRSDYASWQGDQYTADSIAWAEDPLYGWCHKNKKEDGSYYSIYSDGLKIHTTLHPVLQQYAEEAVREHMADFLQPAFNRENKGKANAPFAGNLSAKQREEIITRAIKQSERWRASKAEGMPEDEILASFNAKRKMQVWSWSGMRDTLLSPRDSILYTKSLLRTGFMAMNPTSGHVLAYVGGIDFANFQYDMVSQGRRQVGSTIKPFLYSLSMMDGYSPCDEVLHVQKSYPAGNGKMWTPRNANARRIGEMVSIQWGLQYSDNWVTVELMSRTSPQTFLRLLRSYGFKGAIEPNMAMSLGTPEATVGEMVSAYSTYVNQGVRISPLYVTHIEDQKGNVIATFAPQMTEVLSQNASDKMLYMMQNVVSGGTASRLRNRHHLEMPLAGKTGTTNSNSDAWFVGFSPDIVAGAWVGGEDRSVRFSSMAFGQGAAAALPIFGKFMAKVYGNAKLGYKVSTPFSLPEGFAPCADAGSFGADIYEYVSEEESFSSEDAIQNAFEP